MKFYIAKYSFNNIKNLILKLQINSIIYKFFLKLNFNSKIYKN